MFDLERAIQGWRREMSDAGMKSAEVLDELEGHLRAAVAELRWSGSDVRKAFNRATEEIGEISALRREFGKDERSFMKKSITILLGVLAILIGPALILPALAKHRELHQWNLAMFWPISLGTAIVLVGIGLTILGFKKRTA